MQSSSASLKGALRLPRSQDRPVARDGNARRGEAALASLALSIRNLPSDYLRGSVTATVLSPGHHYVPASDIYRVLINTLSVTSEQMSSC